MFSFDEEPKLKKPMGEWKVNFEITDEHIMEAEIMSGRGLTHTQIANYWGITRNTLQRKARENIELWKALKRGKSKTIAFAAGKLMKKIKDGDTTSIIFYLKTQGRWKLADNENTQYEKEFDEMEQEETVISNDPNEASKTYQYIMLKEVKP